MQWLITAHVRRYHRHVNSSGHVWQGRFKAFPVQSDDHLLTLMRYVERNPVRGKTIRVRKAQAWPWSSAGTAPAEYQRVRLHSGPVKRPTKWLNWVNSALTPAELLDIRNCIARGSPLGTTRWRARTATRLGIESSIRPRGRPKKSAPIK